MAKEEHLAILKQGVEVWNRWRKDHPGIRPDLYRSNFNSVNLNDADLSNAHLNSADLSRASLTGANLSHAYLSGTDLSSADLSKANLTGADLNGVNLSRSTLFDADLSGAYLSGANLSYADLSDAGLSNAQLNNTILRRTILTGATLKSTNLSESLLLHVNLTDCDLQDADLTNAATSNTIVAGTNLSRAKGLSLVKHVGPSYLSLDTLYKSGGNIPEAFLRGCGLQDWEIESVKLYRPNLSNDEFIDIQYRMRELRLTRAVQIKPLFISYSRSDGSFVDSIEPQLNTRGIRFWRDIHHATSGKLERQIDKAIRTHPVVLLILSANSVESDWVQHEARLARKLEQETKSDVLCPIALDNAWKTCDWPERLREQIMEYNVLDFSQWQDAAAFDRMFARLIEGLGIFYK